MDDTHRDGAEVEARLLWALVDRLNLAYFRIDHRRGEVVACNDAYARLLGHASREAAVGSSVFDHYADPRERAEAAARFGQHPGLLRDGFVRFEVQRLRKDSGAPIDLLLSVAPERGESGDIRQLHVIAEGLPSRRTADKAFRDAEARFRVLFDTSAIPMALSAADGTLGRANAAFCRFVGLPEAEVVGSRLIDHVHPDHQASASAWLALPPDRSDEVVPADGIEWRFLRPEGEPAWGLLSTSSLAEHGGPPSRVILVRDISRRRQLEEAIRRMEKLEAVGLLAGGIAHEFNNALTSILGNLQLAMVAGPGDSQVRSWLRQAEQGVVRAKVLTDKLITFAAGGSPVRREISLATLVQDVADTGGCTAPVHLDAPTDLLMAQVDEGQVGQALEHLLVNAAEAMPDGAAVHVRLRNAEIRAGDHVVLPPGPYVQVEVEDCGTGIPARDLPHVFDAYFTTKKRGRGLGLATVLSVARRHGGHVELRSREGAGTTFALWVPAARRAEVAPTPPPVKVPLPVHGRVLVMDDEPHVRDVARFMLERMGLQVVTAVDGAEAVQAYRQALEAGQRFGGVILDLTVRGGLGGVEALQQMLAMDPQVRAIVSSGYSTDPVMAAPEDYGFVGVVPKPYSMAQLGEAVRAVLT